MIMAAFKAGKFWICSCKTENYVKDCFKLINSNQFKGINILLIDDVFTSGSTTNEISKQLKNSGANKIYVLTVAHAGFKQQF